MAVDAAYIAAISRGKYTVGSGTTDAISSTTLESWLAIVAETVAIDAPGTTLSTIQTDLAKALLICHMCELDSSDKTGESMTGYSYSRPDPGTPWLQEYNQLIKMARKNRIDSLFASDTGVTRKDAELGDLRFDRTSISMEADSS